MQGWRAAPAPAPTQQMASLSPCDSIFFIFFLLFLAVISVHGPLSLPSPCRVPSPPPPRRGGEGGCGEHQVFARGSGAFSAFLQPLAASLWDIAGWQCPTWGSTGWCTRVQPAPELPRAPTALPAGAGAAGVPRLKPTPSSAAHQTVALGMGTPCSAPARGQVAGALAKTQMPAPSLPGISPKGHQWHERAGSQSGSQQAKRLVPPN